LNLFVFEHQPPELLVKNELYFALD
jgi:hypothetical protein